MDGIKKTCRRHPGILLGLLLVALAAQPLEARRPRQAAAASEARLAARRERLEKWRAVQLGVREYKKKLRDQRREVASETRDTRTLPPADRGPRPSSCRQGSGSRTRGLACLMLLGLGALTDPGALAQSDDSLGDPVLFPGASTGLPAMGLPAPDPSNWLDTLAQPCGLPPGHGIAPCATGYHATVLEQAKAIQAQAALLLVPPQALGAGRCEPGDSPAEGKERLALALGDVLAAYDGLSADATTLWYQMYRDGDALLAVGAGLFGGEFLFLGVLGTNTTMLSLLAPSILAGVAGGLQAAGAGALVLGAEYGRFANLVLAYRSRYERWALAQNRPGDPCAQAPASSTPALSLSPQETSILPTVPWSPLTPLAQAIQLLVQGCDMARNQGLTLEVCDPSTVQTFMARNATLSNLYMENFECLSAGSLPGVESPCARSGLTHTETRDYLFTFFGEFTAEVGEAALDAFKVGAGFLLGSNLLFTAASVPLQPVRIIDAELTAGEFLAMADSAMGSYGYELLRIASLSRGWQSTLTRIFNAQRRQILDLEKARRLASLSGVASGMDPGPASASSESSTAAGDVPAVAPPTDPRECPVPVPVACPDAPGEARIHSGGASRPAPWLLLGAWW